MGIKLTRQNLLGLLLTFWLIVAVSFFHLFFNGYANKISSIVSCFIFVVSILLWGRLQKGYFSKFVLFFFLILAVNIVSMGLNYDYPLSTFFAYIFLYLVLLCYYPINTYLEFSPQKYKTFLNAIEVIATIQSILLLINELYNVKTGNTFLHVTFLTNISRYSPRAFTVAEGVLRIAVLIPVSKIILNDFRVIGNLKEYFSFVLIALSIIFVDQSRMYILSVLGSIVFMVFVRAKEKISLKRAILLLIVLILVVVIGSVFINSIIITLGDSTNGSNYARAQARTYYLDILRQKFYWMTGLGIAIPDKSNIFYWFIKGPAGIFNYNDIGIVGVLAAFGIFGAIWYIWLLLKSVNLAFKSDGKYKLLSLGLVIEALISIGSLSYLDEDRVVCLPIMLGIISAGYKYSKMGSAGNGINKDIGGHTYDVVRY